jgi:hypothetical protein
MCQFVESTIDPGYGWLDSIEFGRPGYCKKCFRSAARIIAEPVYAVHGCIICMIQQAGV